MNIDTLSKNLLAEVRGRVGIMWLRRTPSNALSSKLSSDLSFGLAALLDHPEIDCVVIASRLAHFSAGSDTSDLTQPQLGSKNELSALCQMVSSSKKPIVAAIHGACLSAGLELALSATARIALVGAQFAFPEIKLGLMPAAGSTLRLPELIGPEPALTMLLDGSVIDAEQAEKIGLIDVLAQQDVVQAACDLALGLSMGTHRVTRRDSAKDARALQVALVEARAKYAGRRLASYDKIITCVEASQIFLPAQAFALERSAYESLLFSDDTQGLCYALLASQRFRSRDAAPIYRMPAGIAALDVNQINILGEGELVAQLAYRAMVSGIQVRLVNPEQNGLMNCLLRVSVLLSQDMSQGHMDIETRDLIWARLRTSSSMDILDDSPIICSQRDHSAGDIYLSNTRQTPSSQKSILVITEKTVDCVADAGVSPQVSAFLGGLLAKMGFKSYDLGRGGFADTQIKDTLSQAIQYLQNQGHARDVILAALASSGIGIDANAALPTAPPKAKIILGAIHLALINRGATLLRENHVPRAVDYDAMVVQAGLFPRWLGGPLYFADRRGLMVVRAELRKLAADAPHLFAPDPLFDLMIAKGRSLTE